MGVYTVNFKRVHKNVDWRQVFKITSDGTTPINISAATFKMTIASSGTTLMTLTLGSGLALVTDGTDGKLRIDVNHLVMETVAVGSYKYDLVMSRGAASEIVMEGTIKVIAGVTDI